MLFPGKFIFRENKEAYKIKCVNKHDFTPCEFTESGKDKVVYTNNQLITEALAMTISLT